LWHPANWRAIWFRFLFPADFSLPARAALRTLPSLHAHHTPRLPTRACRRYYRAFWRARFWGMPAKTTQVLRNTARLFALYAA